MVLDVGQAAGILAGGIFVLPDGLIQRGVAGLVLRIDGNIVVPCRTINGGHGQGHEEGIAGAGDILRDASLHDEIQALLHLVSKGVTGSISLSHGSATVLHGGFQSVLHVRGIGS